MARTAQCNEIRQMIGGFVIVTKIAVWLDVMNINTSVLSSTLAAYLAVVAISLQGFSALTGPIWTAIVYWMAFEIVIASAAHLDGLSLAATSKRTVPTDVFAVILRTMNSVGFSTVFADERYEILWLGGSTRRNRTTIAGGTSPRTEATWATLPCFEGCSAPFTDALFAGRGRRTWLVLVSAGGRAILDFLATTLSKFLTASGAGHSLIETLKVALFRAVDAIGMLRIIKRLFACRANLSHEVVPYWPYVLEGGQGVRLPFRAVHEAALAHTDSIPQVV